MKSHILLLVVALSSVLGAAAQDESKVYLRSDIGPVFQSDLRVKIPSTPELDVPTSSGVRFDVAVGYRVQEGWSVELETGTVWTQLNTVGQHNLYQVPVMANLVWNYPSKRFRPFVGGGLGGVGVISVPSVSGYSTDSSFAFGGQAMAGLRYQFSKHFECGLGYKLLATAPTTLDYVRVSTILTHSVTLSLTYGF